MSGSPSSSSQASHQRTWEPPTPGEISLLLPQYQISELLGRGGMGAVYKGVQINLDRPVAIKILPQWEDQDEAGMSFTERFKNEARSMARLSHSGIVKVFDFGQTDGGMLFIVMEFIEGTDVSRMMTLQGRLPPEHAMAITAHVCDALQYAHDRGIIHRDIKPANIMVGQDGTVKVADFGLARMDKAGESGLTRSGMAMGTLHYMAPEALMLGSAVDQRADVYAVGVMLFFMLTGKLPQGMFTPPSKQVPGLDPRFDDIIVKALRDDREIRYQSAAELRRDLDALLTRPVARVSAEEAQTIILPTQAKTRRTAVPAQQPPPKRAVSMVSVLPWITLAVIAGGSAWLVLKHPTGGDLQPTSKAEVLPATPAKEAKVENSAPMTSPVPVPTTAAANVPPKTEPPKPATSSTSSAPKTSPSATNVEDKDSKMMVSKTQDIPASAKPPATTNAAPLPAGPVTWTDTQGRNITAAYKGMQGDEVLLDIAGRVHPVALSKLATASQKQARDYQTQQAMVPPVSQDASKATSAAPFTNSLGMKFAPVPGTKVLFCLHETRWKDFAAHMAESPNGSSNWKNQRHYGFGITDRKEDHPVVLVSWDEAQAFCQWLSQKEGKTYRLPTELEWNMAVGTDEFPWGSQWPPPEDAGNYNDESRKAKAPYPTKNELRIEGLDDGFPTTAPVMSFKPNPLGLYDIGGNVWEWTEDWYDNKLKERVLRGGSWVNHERNCMTASHRHRFVPGSRHAHHGFRVVLETR
jgi:serine/threonine protein kinase